MAGQGIHFGIGISFFLCLIFLSQLFLFTFSLNQNAQHHINQNSNKQVNHDNDNNNNDNNNIIMEGEFEFPTLPIELSSSINSHSNFHSVGQQASAPLNHKNRIISFDSISANAMAQAEISIDHLMASNIQLNNKVDHQHNLHTHSSYSAINQPNDNNSDNQQDNNKSDDTNDNDNENENTKSSESSFASVPFSLESSLSDNGENENYFMLSGTGAAACTPNPCLNSGTCTLITPNPGYTCTCASAYIGTNCQTLRTAAPVPLSATLSASLTSIVIAFDSPTNKAGSGCGSYFSTTTLNLLSNNNPNILSCTFDSAQSLTITSPSVFAAPVVPTLGTTTGSSITLLGNVLLSQDGTSQLNSGATLTLLPPVNPSPLTVSITPLSNTVSGCTDFQATGQETSGIGGRTFTYSWSLSAGAGSLSTAQLSALNTYLATVTSPTITVPSYYLPPLSSYGFKLSVSSWFGGSGSATASLTKSGLVSPTVTIDKTSVTIARGDTVTITATANLGACANAAISSIVWTQTSPSTATPIPSAYLTLPGLVIPSNTLIPGTTYTFLATASASVGSLSAQGVATATVIVSQPASPVPVSATFSNDLTNVIVKFSAATNQAGMARSSPCTSILSSDAFITATTAPGGVTLSAGESTTQPVAFVSDCYWTASDTLLVSWIPQSLNTAAGITVPIALRVGTTITFASNGALKSQDGFSLGLPAGKTLNVLAPVSGPSPVPLITYPSTIGSCDGLTVDGSASTGTGGRPLSFAWSSSNGGSSLSTYLSGLSAKTATWTTTTNLPTQSFADFQFQITGVFTNWLGASTTQPFLITRSAGKVPTISIAGGVSQSTSRYSAFTVGASVVGSPCLGTPSLQWTLTSQTINGVSLTTLPTYAASAFTIPSSQSTLSSFIIPANSLIPTAVYTFQITATAPGGSSNQNMTLTVTPISTPVLLSAIFANAMNGVTVTFDSNTNQPIGSGNAIGSNTYSNCLAIFDTATVALFASGQAQPVCQWTTPSTVFITLGSGFTLSPSNSQQGTSTLTVLSGVITSADTFSAPITTGRTVSVAAPLIPPTVTPFISTQSSVSYCQSISLDGSGSTGGGGRSLTFSWSIVPDPTSGLLPQVYTNITNALSALGSTAVVNNLDPNLFPPGYSFQFQLFVSSWLGVTASTSTTVSKASVQIPYVALKNAVSQSNYYVSQPVTSTAIVSAPVCSSNSVLSSVNRVWSITSPDSAPVDFQLASNVINSNVLYVPPYTMTPGRTYTFKLTVTVTISGVSLQAASSSLTVTIIKQALLANLVAPSVVSIQNNEDKLTLDASSTTNPNDKTGGTSSAITYTWSCQLRLRGGPCPGFSNPIGSSTDKKYVLRNKDLTATTPLASPNVPPLSTDDAWVVTVTASAANALSSSASATIQLTAATIPSLTIVSTLNYALNNYPSAQPLKLQASTSDGHFNYSWSCVSGNLVLTSANIGTTSLNVASLVINANVLSAATYTFALTITETSSLASVTGSISVTVSLAPTSGYCSVNPSTGPALLTYANFQLSCPGWVTANPPLTYSFSLVSGSALTPLVLPQIANQTANVTLPQGSLTIEASITDLLGQVTKVQFPVTVTALNIASAGGTAAVENTIATNLANAAAIGDTALFAQSLIQASSLLTNTNTSGVATTLRTQYINALATLAASSSGSDIAVSAQVQMTASICNDPTQLSAQSLSLCSSIVSNALSSSSSDSDQQAVVSVASNVVTGSNKKNQNSNSGKYHLEATTATITPQQAAQQLQNIIAQLTNISLSTKLVGEKPTVISASGTTLIIRLDSPPLVSGAGTTIANAGGSVTLPYSVYSSFLSTGPNGTVVSSPCRVASQYYTATSNYYSYIDVTTAPASISAINGGITSYTLFNACPTDPLFATPISIVNTTTPIHIVLPAVQPAGLQASCDYYDTSLQTWRNDGCTWDQAGSTLNTTSCYCNHLTQFAVGTKAVFSSSASVPYSSSSSSSTPYVSINGTGSVDTYQVQASNISKWPIVIIAICVVSGLWIIATPFILSLDRKLVPPTEATWSLLRDYHKRLQALSTGEQIRRVVSDTFSSRQIWTSLWTRLDDDADTYTARLALHFLVVFTAMTVGALMVNNLVASSTIVQGIIISLIILPFHAVLQYLISYSYAAPPPPVVNRPKVQKAAPPVVAPIVPAPQAAPIENKPVLDDDEKKGTTPSLSSSLSDSSEDSLSNDLPSVNGFGDGAGDDDAETTPRVTGRVYVISPPRDANVPLPSTVNDNNNGAVGSSNDGIVGGGDNWQSAIPRRRLRTTLWNPEWLVKTNAGQEDEVKDGKDEKKEDQAPVVTKNAFTQGANATPSNPGNNASVAPNDNANNNNNGNNNTAASAVAALAAANEEKENEGDVDNDNNKPNVIPVKSTKGISNTVGIIFTLTWVIGCIAIMLAKVSGVGVSLGSDTGDAWLSWLESWLWAVAQESLINHPLFFLAQTAVLLSLRK